MVAVVLALCRAPSIITSATNSGSCCSSLRHNILEYIEMIHVLPFISSKKGQDDTIFDSSLWGQRPVGVKKNMPSFLNSDFKFKKLARDCDDKEGSGGSPPTPRSDFGRHRYNTPLSTGQQTAPRIQCKPSHSDAEVKAP